MLVGIRDSSSAHSAPPARPSRFDQLLIALLIGGVIGLIGLTGWYATLRNINWDEFFYLSQVYDAAAQRPLRPLQTFHVQLFSWLAGSARTEIDEINNVRILLLVLHALTCSFLFAIARRRLALPAALFSVMCFAGFSYVISHGTSFRTDPLATFLLVSAVYCMLQNTVLTDLLAALVLGIAFAITIKVVLFAPCAAGIILYQRSECGDNWRKVARRATRLGAATMFVSFSLVLLHCQLLGMDSAHAAAQSATVSSDSGQKMFQLWPPLPRQEHAAIAFRENRAIWVLMLIAACMMLKYLSCRGQRPAGIWLLAVLWPTVTILFYRNAFPYFYVMIMPFGALAAAEVFEQIWMRFQRQRRSGWAALLLLLPLLNTIAVMKSHLPRLIDQQITQRQHVSLAHAMFPAPVPYIDRSATVSRFPKAGFFMSTWGLEKYRAANKPIMKDLLQRHQPYFLVANGEPLAIDIPTSRDAAGNPHLLIPEDFDTLAAAFVPFWGRIFVAGRCFDSLSANVPHSFELLVGGRYVLESAQSVVVDGQQMQVGEVRPLAPGEHTIRSSEDGQAATLRIQTAVPAPKVKPSNQPFYFKLAV